MGFSSSKEQDVELSYRIASENDSSEIIKMVARVFLQGEPMTHDLPIDALGWEAQVRAAVEISIQHNLCYICEATTGAYSRIVSSAVCLDHDKEDEFEQRYEELTTEKQREAFGPLFTVLEELNAMHIFSGKVLHFFMGATVSDMAGKGLTTSLCQFVIAKAKKKDFDFMVAECTNPATQHIMLNKFKADNVGEINWREYEIDGVRPLTSKKGNGKVILTLLDLSKDLSGEHCNTK